MTIDFADHEPVTLAYLAGYFDADGCITIRVRRRGSTTISCRITSVNEPMIRWLQTSFGGWVACQRQPKANRREAFNWGLDHASCLPFLEAVIPYLRMKRAEAEVALQLQRLVSARYRTGHVLSEDELTARRSLHSQFKDAKAAR